jgi:hypothetical protein
LLICAIGDTTPAPAQKNDNADRRTQPRFFLHVWNDAQGCFNVRPSLAPDVLPLPRSATEAALQPGKRSF